MLTGGLHLCGCQQSQVAHSPSGIGPTAAFIGVQTVPPKTKAELHAKAAKISPRRLVPLRDVCEVRAARKADRKSLMNGWICQEVKQSNGVNYFNNLQQPDCKNLCFPEHRVWLRRHKSNHGWNRTR